MLRFIGAITISTIAGFLSAILSTRLGLSDFSSGVIGGFMASAVFSALSFSDDEE